MDLSRYTGRTFEIIYEDRHGNLSQRRILVQKVDSGKVRAYCYTSRAPRLFHVEQILTVQLVSRAV